MSTVSEPLVPTGPSGPVAPGRVLTPRFLILSLAHFLGGCSILGMTLLPLFIEDLGGDAFDIGVIMATAAVAGVLARPLIGRVIDRSGRRTAFLLSGGLNVLGCVLYLMVTEIGPLFYLARVLAGIGAGGIFATFFTAAGDIIPPQRRSEGIALFGISGMAAGAAGPFLGELALNTAGFTAFFWLMVGMAGASLVTSVSLPEASRESSPGDRRLSTSILEALTDPGVVRLWPVTILFGFAISGFSTFIAPWAEENAVRSVSLYFIPYSATAIILRLFFSRLPDRIGYGRVIIPAMLCFVGTGVAIALMPSDPGFVLGGILGGTGHGLGFPVLAALALKRGDPTHRGSVMSLFTASIDVGVLTCGPLLGALARASGYGNAFLAAGASAAVGAVAFWVAERRG